MGDHLAISRGPFTGPLEPSLRQVFQVGQAPSGPTVIRPLVWTEAGPQRAAYRGGGISCGLALSLFRLLCPRPHSGALSDDAHLTSVCRIFENRERHRKTKIDTEVGHVTRDSDYTFKVKRSKVNL